MTESNKPCNRIKVENLGGEVYDSDFSEIVGLILTMHDPVMGSKATGLRVLEMCARIDGSPEAKAIYEQASKEAQI